MQTENTRVLGRVSCNKQALIHQYPVSNNRVALTWANHYHR